MARTDDPRAREMLKGWAIVLAISVALLAWGIAIFLMVRDRPRAWDFGALRDAPSQSIYSSESAPAGSAVPRQIAPLPEATRR